MLHCPRCAIPIAELNPGGLTEVTCARCRFEYRYVYGPLTRIESREITGKDYLGHPRPEARAYTLIITLPSGDVEELKFDVPASRAPLRAERGDSVGILYTVRRGDIEELVLIDDPGSGTPLRIRDPGSRTRAMATLGGIIGAVAGLLIGGWTAEGTGLAVVSSLAVGGLMGSGAFLYLRRSLQPGRNAGADLTHVAQLQALLAEKERLLLARSDVRREHQGQQRQRDRLEGLRRRMIEAGRELYEARLAAIDRATALIDNKLTVDRELLARYDATIRMVDIELESGQLAQDVPDEIARVMDVRRGELRELQDRSADMRRQITANDEVDRVLGP